MDEFSKHKLTKEIEHIKKSLMSIDKTLALQHQSLETHIKRTDLLENKLEPVEKHVEQVRGVVQLLMFLVAVAGVIAAFLVIK